MCCRQNSAICALAPRQNATRKKPAWIEPRSNRGQSRVESMCTTPLDCHSRHPQPAREITSRPFTIGRPFGRTNYAVEFFRFRTKGNPSPGPLTPGCRKPQSRPRHGLCFSHCIITDLGSRSSSKKWPAWFTKAGTSFQTVHGFIPASFNASTSHEFSKPCPAPGRELPELICMLRKWPGQPTYRFSNRLARRQGLAPKFITLLHPPTRLSPNPPARAIAPRGNARSGRLQCHLSCNEALENSFREAR